MEITCIFSFGQVPSEANTSRAMLSDMLTLLRQLSSGECNNSASCPYRHVSGTRLVTWTALYPPQFESPFACVTVGDSRVSTMDLLLQAKLVLLSTEATNYWGSWTAVAGSPHATHTLQRMYGRSVLSRPSKAQLNIPKCRVRMQRSKAEPWKARLGAKLRMLGSTLLCICGICSFRPPSCEGVKPDQPARHLSRGPSMLTGAY